MAVFPIRPRAFRTRNPGRDVETDSARIETVRNAILMAVSDARRERDGLQQRMDLHYARATTMLDAAAEYAERPVSEEAAIRSSEQGAANARRRLAQLDAQIERFEGMIAELDGTAAQDAGVA